MITIKGIIKDGYKDGPERELTPEEKETVTSVASIGDDYVYYQGDEPEIEPEPIVIPPNWYGMEQALFKSPMFGKYIQDYNTKGLLWQSTVNNGKAGFDVNEQTLLMGFTAMQIDFTPSEIQTINTILTNNNFTIQL